MELSHLFSRQHTPFLILVPLFLLVLLFLLVSPFPITVLFLVFRFASFPLTATGARPRTMAGAAAFM